MANIEKVVTAQQSGVQSALGSAHRAAVIDTLSSTGIGAEVVAGSWPAVLEDSGSRFPLTGQGAADRVGNQTIAMSSKIEAGQGPAHLSLRAEQCRGHAITDPMPRASSTSANAESTDSSWSPSRTGSSETRWSRRCRADSTMARR